MVSGFPSMRLSPRQMEVEEVEEDEEVFLILTTSLIGASLSSVSSSFCFRSSLRVVSWRSP